MSGHRRVIPAESCANDLVLLAMLLAWPCLTVKWCQTSPQSPSTPRLSPESWESPQDP